MNRNHSLFASNRRNFIKNVAVTGTGLAAGWKYPVQAAAEQGGGPLKKAGIKLGLDNFAVRAMNWKAPQLIDYAASLDLDSLFISDLDAFESFDRAYLEDLKKRAADQALQIHVGTWSICPTSKTFRDKWGTAEEHLALGIRVAQAVGSPVIRVILGSGQDRSTEGGIMARIADTVKVCRSKRSQALDAGVKIAVENHAGDMQARELVILIEEAGPEYVGANFDSGNATWTMEAPTASLEILGPYVATTSLRDSAIWESERGATVQWTAMGDGNVDLQTFFQRFAVLCPRVPVHIETISGFNREIPYFDDGFWDVWPDTRAKDFAQFLALAKQGKPREPHRHPSDVDRRQADQEYQKAQLEKSLRYCRQHLGLGVKP